MTNAERADRAATILAAFVKATRDTGDSEHDYALVDLLADFKHLSDRNGWNFTELCEQAYNVHFSERAGYMPRETPSTKWFIVVGRAHGDDECSSAVYEAIDALDAEQQFDAAMRESHDWPTEHADDDEAEGRIIYLDQTFECDTAPRLT